MSFLVAVMGLSLAGCGGEPPALEVGPVAFTAEELGAMGGSQQRVLADLIGLGLAVAQDRVDTLVAPFVARDLRSIVLQRLAMELSADDAGLGETELRRRYSRDPRYELDVRHLVILSERWRPAEHRDSARAVAREALERVRDGEPFDKLAAAYSDEPGAEKRGGLLEPGREGSWVPEFWEAASSLEVGRISGVVETEFGFHVLKLEDRRAIPFEEVRAQVLRSIMDLPSALGRAEAWASARMRVANVDTSAIRRWVRDDTVPATLITWPDSLGYPPFTADDYRTIRSGREPTRPDSATSGLDRTVEKVRAAAQTHMMMRYAERVGVRPTAAERAAIEQRWRDRVRTWAAPFGFEYGQSEELVKEEALQGVGAAEQSAAIARAEIQAIRPRLRGLYPVRRPAR